GSSARAEGSHGGDQRLPPSSAACSVSGAGRPARRHCLVLGWPRRGGPPPRISVRWSLVLFSVPVLRAVFHLPATVQGAPDRGRAEALGLAVGECRRRRSAHCTRRPRWCAMLLSPSWLSRRVLTASKLIRGSVLCEEDGGAIIRP